MAKVLVVSSDTVGAVMAGPGIRALEMARTLAGAHEVTLAAPPPLPELGLRVVETRRSELAAAAADSDTIVVQGPAFDLLPSPLPAPLVVDLYDPAVIEGLEMHAGDAAVAKDVDRLLRQVAAADLVLCASPRQRLFWLGVLAAAGRLNRQTYDGDPTLGGILEVAPFGVADGRPERTGALRRELGLQESDFVVAWGGGIWNWLDPLTPIRAIAAAAAREPRLKLVFLGGGHPTPGVPAMRMAETARAAAQEAGVAGVSVFFRTGWAPYAERGELLADADAGITAHRPGVEAELAYRTRVLDYLWAGLPVLASEGDELAEEAARDGFGLTFPPGDHEALAAALLRLTADDELRRGLSRAAAAAAEKRRWAAVLEPLTRFCASPHYAPDRGTRLQTPGLLRESAQTLAAGGPAALAHRARRYLRRRL